MSFKESIRWVIALKPEAKKIIEKYNLVLCKKYSGFQVYCKNDQDHWLIISGIGEKNIKRSISYLKEISDVKKWTIWINLGIAGNTDNYGKLFVVDEINSLSSPIRYFPHIGIKKNFNRKALMSLESPCDNYSDNYLIDMEGYSFFENTHKLSNRELIYILKVVSDDRRHSIKNISKDIIYKLISNVNNEINIIISYLIRISEIIFNEEIVAFDFDKLNNKWHFSFSQKVQMKSLVKRWKVLFPSRDIMKEVSHFKKSKLIIEYLNTKFENYEIEW